MTPDEPRPILERLGLSPEALRTIEPLLERLDLEEAEIRERLWRGHLAYARRAARGEAEPER